MGTRAALALAVLLAACEGPTPPGASHVGPDADLHDFSLSSDGRRACWTEGRFPRKTTLVLRAVDGNLLRTRFPGRSLSGPCALAADGKTALASAATMVSSRSPRASPDPDRLLWIDATGGALIEERVLPAGAQLLAVAGPRWAPGPLAVWRTGREAGWAAFSASAPLLGWTEGRYAAEGPAMLAEDEPLVALAAAPPALVVLDLRAGTVVRRFPVGLKPLPLAWTPSGLLLASSWSAPRERHLVELLDPRDGSRRVVTESDGEPESALAWDEEALLIARDPSRRGPSGRDWMAARLLLSLDLPAGATRWSLPWTSRPGRLLGRDREERVLFTVTDADQPALWALPDGRESLAAAVPVLDGTTRLAGRFLALLSQWLLGLAGAAAAGMALYFFRR